MIRYAIFYLCIGVFLLSACIHAPIVPPYQSAVSFKNDVQPVLIGNCTSAGCHDATAGGEQVFSLITYDDVINNGGIQAGKPAKSKLYRAISGKGDNLMPPNGKMADSQISVIYIWIEQGAKNN